LGTVLVTFVVTQNLGSIVYCQFQRIKGRYASLLPLTRLNWRASPQVKGRLFEAVKQL
jgi:hypothetical protein